MIIRTLSCALALSVASFASAAKITAIPSFAGAFDPVSSAPIDGYDPLTATTPAVIQFDVLVSIEDLAADEFGLANVFFSAGFEGGYSDIGAGWNAFTPIPIVDSNGPAFGGNVNLWADNADFGAADLKDIAFGVATPLTTQPAVDPRWNVGKTAPQNVGFIYALYDGTGGTFSITPTQGSVLRANGNGEVASSTVFVGGTYGEAVIPEPTTCILAGLALVGVAAGRRV